MEPLNGLEETTLDRVDMGIGLLLGVPAICAPSLANTLRAEEGRPELIEQNKLNTARVGWIASRLFLISLPEGLKHPIVTVAARRFRGPSLPHPCQHEDPSSNVI